jgi:beta-xylosidase
MDWNISVQEPEQAAPDSTERLDLPEGVYELKIKTVSEDTTQLVLELAHEDRRYWWVKVSLKKGQTWARVLVAQLAGALALSEQQWAETQSDDLTGRRVMAEIRHRVSPVNGRTFVNVWKFMAIPQLAEEAAVVAKKPAARTPAAKVKATAPAIGSDDIPF